MSVLNMKLLALLLVLITFDFGNGKLTTIKPHPSSSIKYFTKNDQAITIDIMFHMDPALALKLAKHYGSRTRRKLKEISRNILKDVGRFFQHRSLNQTIRFRLMDTKFIRNSKYLSIDENASKYLKSYCDWQGMKKMITRRWYYSVLLTGLDVFYVDNLGKEVRASTGRGYMSAMCTMKKSCTLIEWHPRNIGFLLAHEIAHSLSVNHDSAYSGKCQGNHVMGGKYNSHNHPRTWSQCSQHALKQFLLSDRSWCLKPKYGR